MTQKLSLYQYQEFVDGVTSGPSKNFDEYISRLNELNDQGCDIARLDMAGNGLCSESGEFAEYIKKIKFHGKPYNEENILKMKKELGDVSWYWINACKALNVDPYEVLDENVKKLKTRYPEGFDIARSEHRMANDV